MPKWASSVFFQKNNPARKACRNVVNEQKNFHFELECVSLLKNKYVKFVLILTMLYLEPLKGKEIKDHYGCEMLHDSNIYLRYVLK